MTPFLFTVIVTGCGTVLLGVFAVTFGRIADWFDRFRASRSR